MIALAVAGCHPPGWGKDHDADAGVDAATGPDAGESPDADPDAAPVMCTGNFRLEGHGAATSVWLTGDFVGWTGTPAGGAVALVLGVDGAWTASRSFDAGSYQYKFIVDGSSWIPDPANPETIDDGFGGTNSVYRCM